MRLVLTNLAQDSNAGSANSHSFSLKQFCALLQPIGFCAILCQCNLLLKSL
jgi:hypothetical protein